MTERAPLRVAIVIAVAVFATGCAVSPVAGPSGRYAEPIGTAPVIDNDTPYTPMLDCLAGKIADTEKPRIAVGEIRDHTGKYSEYGGAKVTQGAALMAVSALARLGVPLVERLDTGVADRELKLANNNLISDADNVRLIYPGAIPGSDFYLVGGITELNYNLRSVAADAFYSSGGVGARLYVLNLALDLRLVETQSLRIVDVVSYQKQISRPRSPGRDLRILRQQSLRRFHRGTRARANAVGRAGDDREGHRRTGTQAVWTGPRRLCAIPSTRGMVFAAQPTGAYKMKALLITTSAVALLASQALANGNGNGPSNGGTETTNRVLNGQLNLTEPYVEGDVDLQKINGQANVDVSDQIDSVNGKVMSTSSHVTRQINNGTVRAAASVGNNAHNRAADVTAAAIGNHAHDRQRHQPVRPGNGPSEPVRMAYIRAQYPLRPPCATSRQTFVERRLDTTR